MPAPKMATRKGSSHVRRRDGIAAGGGETKESKKERNGVGDGFVDWRIISPFFGVCLEKYEASSLGMAAASTQKECRRKDCSSADACGGAISGAATTAASTEQQERQEQQEQQHVGDG